jgi:carboxylate-amine ligase
VRFGLDGKLVDFGRGEAVPMRFLARELVMLLDDVLDDLGSRREVEYVYTILDEGTSAHRQLDRYRDSKANGADDQEALHAVVDMLRSETMKGIKEAG